MVLLCLCCEQWFVVYACFQLLLYISCQAACAVRCY
jgi:hypothetical protein